MKMVGCSAIFCSNNTTHGLKFYRFPRDTERQEIWLKNCGRVGWIPGPGACLCEAHFEDSQFELHRADGLRKLKPNAIPTIFNSSMKGDRKPFTHQFYKREFIYDFPDDLDTDEQVVSRGRSGYHSRGRRRGRRPKRHRDDDESDDWTPKEQAKSYRGRRRGRPPGSSSRARSAYVHPPSKVPREEIQAEILESYIECEKQAIDEPKVLCFVCNKAITKNGTDLQTLTPTTKVHLHQKLGKLVAGELDLLIDEEGTLCAMCTRLINYIDRIEVELHMLNKVVLNSMRRKYGLDVHSNSADYADIKSKQTAAAQKVEVEDGEDSVDYPPTVEEESNHCNDEDGFLDSQVSKQPASEEMQCRLCTFRTPYMSVFIFHLRLHMRDSKFCDFCNTNIPYDKDLSVNGLSERSSDLSFTLANGFIPCREQEAAALRDDVETMMEELHTTGSVSCMKEMFADSSNLQHLDSGKSELNSFDQPVDCSATINNSKVNDVSDSQDMYQEVIKNTLIENFSDSFSENTSSQSELIGHFKSVSSEENTIDKLVASESEISSSTVPLIVDQVQETYGEQSPKPVNELCESSISTVTEGESCIQENCFLPSTVSAPDAKEALEILQKEIGGAADGTLIVDGDSTNITAVSTGNEETESLKEQKQIDENDILNEWLPSDGKNGNMWPDNNLEKKSSHMTTYCSNWLPNESSINNEKSIVEETPSWINSEERIHEKSEDEETLINSWLSKTAELETNSTANESLEKIKEMDGSQWLSEKDQTPIGFDTSDVYDNLSGN